MGNIIREPRLNKPVVKLAQELVTNKTTLLQSINSNKYLQYYLIQVKTDNTDFET